MAQFTRQQITAHSYSATHAPLRARALACQELARRAGYASGIGGVLLAAYCLDLHRLAVEVDDRQKPAELTGDDLRVKPPWVSLSARPVKGWPGSKQGGTTAGPSTTGW